MRKSLYLAPAAALAASLWVGSAQATIQTFVGQDDGAPVGGPFPNSVAAQAAFEAAAATFGSLNTITYENLAVGFSSPIAAAPGVSITLNAPNFGNGFSGISNTTFGNLDGFNTTPGGSQWLGSPGARQPSMLPLPFRVLRTQWLPLPGAPGCACGCDAFCWQQSGFRSFERPSSPISCSPLD